MKKCFKTPPKPKKKSPEKKKKILQKIFFFEKFSKFFRKCTKKKFFFSTQNRLKRTQNHFSKFVPNLGGGGPIGGFWDRTPTLTL